MNWIADVIILISCVAAGFAFGVVVTRLNRAEVDKFINDTLKDNDGAWDYIRCLAGFGATSATAITLYHMALDQAIWDHMHAYGLGLGEIWGAYAGAVVGHSFAKK